MADTKANSGKLLDIRNLRIEATVYPPGEAPKTITLVHDVSLTLEKGKVLGLIGESGAGKSTIGLSSMAYGRGGVRITGGEVILNGRDILQQGKNGIRKLRGREVCYVAQSAAAAFNPAQRLMDQVGRIPVVREPLPGALRARNVRALVRHIRQGRDTLFGKPARRRDGNVRREFRDRLRHQARFLRQLVGRAARFDRRRRIQRSIVPHQRPRGSDRRERVEPLGETAFQVLGAAAPVHPALLTAAAGGVEEPSDALRGTA